MKTIKFIYKVAGFKWEDTVAFGEAWRAAKAKAAELHQPIFRSVVKANGTIHEQVFYNGGVFNSVEFMGCDNVRVF